MLLGAERVLPAYVPSLSRVLFMAARSGGPLWLSLGCAVKLGPEAISAGPRLFWFLICVRATKKGFQEDPRCRTSDWGALLQTRDGVCSVWHGSQEVSLAVSVLGPLGSRGCELGWGWCVWPRAFGCEVRTAPRQGCTARACWGGCVSVPGSALHLGWRRFVVGGDLWSAARALTHFVPRTAGF